MGTKEVGGEEVATGNRKQGGRRFDVLLYGLERERKGEGERATAKQ